MNPVPGTYVLVLRCDAERSVSVGRWGTLDVRSGYYLYVGSAFGPGGVRARVMRHCLLSKRKHWHIDYLRDVATLEEVWYSHSPERVEHDWAGVLNRMDGSEPVRGFGCSDCRCESHLFYFVALPNQKTFCHDAGGPVDVWTCPEDTN